MGLGLVTALPTAASGLADWSDTIGEERRLGLAHAAGNIVAVVLYGLSLVSRLRGRRAKGVLLSFLGAGAATAGAYLGGHLAWRKGVNVSRHAWQESNEDWTDVAAEDELSDDGPVVVKVGDDPVLIVRQGGRLFAISDVCDHLGGPLHEGEIADGCVTCPWHASVFRLDDGSVVHGPATGPQPAYQVLRKAGRVWLRRVSTLEPQPVPVEARGRRHELGHQPVDRRGGRLAGVVPAHVGQPVRPRPRTAARGRARPTPAPRSAGTGTAPPRTRSGRSPTTAISVTGCSSRSTAARDRLKAGVCSAIGPASRRRMSSARSR